MYCNGNYCKDKLMTLLFDMCVAYMDSLCFQMANFKSIEPVVPLTRGSWVPFPPGDRDVTGRLPSGDMLPSGWKVDVWRVGGCH